MTADKETILIDLLNSWLDVWGLVEDNVVLDSVWEQADELAEWTRQEVNGGEELIVRCPNCNSLKLVPCDDLKDDEGHCIEWECDDCGYVINNY